MVSPRPKEHKGNNNIRSALVMKLFLENKGKSYSYDEIMKYLAKHNVKASYMGVARIIYDISAIIPIEEAVFDRHKYFWSVIE